MSKITLQDVTSGFQAALKIKSNFDLISDHLNNKVLYRDNVSGEPNTLENDIDTNGFRLLNSPEPLENSHLTTKYYVDKAISDNSGTAVAFSDFRFDLFEADGVTTTFTLTSNPMLEANTNVFVDGVFQSPDTYSLSNSQIIFSTAPPAPLVAGTKNVVVHYGRAVEQGASSAGITTIDSHQIGATNIQSLHDKEGMYDYEYLNDLVNEDLSKLQVGEIIRVKAVSSSHPTAPASWKLVATSTTPPDAASGINSDGYFYDSASGARKFEVVKENGYRTEWWGAKFDGSTDDSTAWKAALAFIKSKGGGIIQASAGTTLMKDVELPAGVFIVGVGSYGTILKLPNNANTDVLRTENFSTLTGSNKWLTSDGVPHGFGLVGLRVDGNKTNNTSGYGIRIYGKRYFIDDVIVIDTPNDGVYSECAAVGGQTDWTDLPETLIKSLWIRSCGGNGLTYRGPHDGRIGVLYAALNSGDGVAFEGSTTYSGNCNVGNIHTYSNKRGIYANSFTELKIEMLETESNTDEGAVFDNAGGGVSIGILKAYKNWSQYSASEAPAANASIECKNVTRINQAFIRTDYGGTGLKMNGAIVSDVGYVEVDGEGTNGVGVEVDGNQINLACNVHDFNGGTGTGVKLHTTAGRNANKIRLVTRTCNTHLNNVNAANGSVIEGDIYTSAGETAVAGVGPGGSNTEKWSLEVRGASSGQTWAKGSVTLLAANTSVTVTHGLLFTPQSEDLQVTPSANMGSATKFWIANITSTTFDIRVDIAPGTDTPFVWSAQL